MMCLPDDPILSESGRQMPANKGKRQCVGYAPDKADLNGFLNLDVRGTKGLIHELMNCNSMGFTRRGRRAWSEGPAASLALLPHELQKFAPATISLPQGQTSAGECTRRLRWPRNTTTTTMPTDTTAKSTQTEWQKTMSPNT